MIRRTYRLTAADSVTLVAALDGVPPKTIRAIEHLVSLAEDIPGATLVFPSPEDGIFDLWELRYDDQHEFVAVLRALRHLEPCRAS